MRGYATSGTERSAQPHPYGGNTARSGQPLGYSQSHDFNPSSTYMPPPFQNREYESYDPFMGDRFGTRGQYPRGNARQPSQQETFGSSTERVLFNQQLRTQGAPSVSGVSRAPHARVAPTRTRVNTLTPTSSSRDTQDTSSVMHDPAVLNTGAIHTAPHTVNGGENSVSREMAVPLVNDNINMGRESTELNTDLELTVNSRDTHDVSVNEESEIRHEASILENFLESTQSSGTVLETETETEHVHVPSDTPHTVDSPA